MIKASSEFSKGSLNKNCKRYFIVQNNKVYFSGDFDSGNLQKVQQIGYYEYRIFAGLDHPTQLCTVKSFFHFKVSGFEQCRVRFHVCRLQLLKPVVKNNQFSNYRPVYKTQQRNCYERINDAVKIIINQNQQVEMIFEFSFNHERVVYFAFSYPYSYARNCEFISEISKLLTYDEEIYFNKQTLIHSHEGRKIHLLTITNKQNCQQQRQEYIEGLFPEDQIDLRPLKIKQKPIIVVTARVHPGETTASYSFQGLLRFLINKTDYRAYLLRKHFHFLLIPMLNPDGVAHGMYRLDMKYNNLNRFYGHCTEKQQPSIWALKTLLNKIGKIHFYFDLHGHASKKGFFVYGNGFGEISYQSEAESFAKILEINCPFFQYSSSNFNQKNMKTKDLNDLLTKEGCARVYMHKRFNIIHSYTVQTGFFLTNNLNPNVIIKNSDKKFDQYQCSTIFQNQTNKFYTPISYMNMGKNILVSILDIFERNPYSKLENTQYKTIHNIRKIISMQIYQNSERFKQNDLNCGKKIKSLSTLISEYYSQKFSTYSILQKSQPQKKQTRNTNNKSEPISKTMRSTSNKNFRKKKLSSNPVELQKVSPQISKQSLINQYNIIKMHEKSLETEKKLQSIIQNKHTESLGNIKKLNFKPQQNYYQNLIQFRLNNLKQFLNVGQKKLNMKNDKRLVSLPSIQKRSHQQMEMPK